MNFIRKLLNATLLLLGVLILVTFFLALNSCDTRVVCYGSELFDGYKERLGKVLDSSPGDLCQKVSELAYKDDIDDVETNRHLFCSSEILELNALISKIESRDGYKQCQ